MLLRKVKLSEFAEEFFRDLIIRMCGFFGTGKATQISRSPIESNFGTPSFIYDVVRYTLKTRFVVTTLPCIGLILRLSTKTQIAFTIIERVSVDVINLLVYTQHGTVHEDNTVRTGFITHCIKLAGDWSARHAPIVLINTFIIFSVDNGVLALGEWNQPYTLIQRLGYCMSDNMSFCHRPTPIGLWTQPLIIPEVG